MRRGRGVGQTPQVAVRLPRASELQESPPALDRWLGLPLLLRESHPESIPPVQVPATWQSQSPAPAPLLLASPSPERRDLECDHRENSCLALFSKLPSWPSISQVHSSAPKIVMSLKSLEVHLSALTRPSKGWSVKILPVRSTVLASPKDSTHNHAFTARKEGADCTPATTLFPGCSDAPMATAFRTRKVEATCFACGVFRNS
jgi:hypothetical protein